MRYLTALALLGAAAPVAAQTPAPSPPQEVERALDPAMADRLTNAMEALSDALMNLPVGEVQAAVEGRAPTAQERKLTVRDVARRDHVDVRRQIAEAKPMIRQSMKALSTALPAMMKSLDDMQQALDRAAANMPDPTYPRR